jgi:hypothetical protein
MKQSLNERGVLPILVAIFIVVLIAAAGVAAYNVSKSDNKDDQTAKASLSPTSSSSATASPIATPTPTPDSTFDVSDLGVKFTLSGSLWDLDYKVVHLTGDQAVNSVAFSSKRLEAAGCSLDSAPLGYLTYDNDKGGVMVATARNSSLYYLQPQAGCNADVSLRNWQVLQSGLRTLASDK